MASKGPSVETASSESKFPEQYDELHHARVLDTTLLRLAAIHSLRDEEVVSVDRLGRIRDKPFEWRRKETVDDAGLDISIFADIETPFAPPMYVREAQNIREMYACSDDTVRKAYYISVPIPLCGEWKHPDRVVISSGSGHSVLYVHSRDEDVEGKVIAEAEGLDPLAVEDTWHDWTFAFGENHVGQCGIGVLLPVLWNPTRLTRLDRIPVKAISCGHSHSLILSDAGKLYVCGANHFGQLGVRDVITRPVALEHTLLEKTKVVAIGCGVAHSVVITDSGKALSCGMGAAGQLGWVPPLRVSSAQTPTTPLHPIPDAVLFEEIRSESVRFTTVACGALHTLLLDDAGHVHVMGCNRHGQLGLGHIHNVGVPYPLAYFQEHNLTVKSIHAGGSHSLFLTTNGRVYATGRNSFGQLGLGHRWDMLLPVHIDHPEFDSAEISAVACGTDHTVFLLSSGVVMTCGRGSYGALGHGDKNDRLRPTVVFSMLRLPIVEIAAGWNQTFLVHREECSANPTTAVATTTPAANTSRTANGSSSKADGSVSDGTGGSSSSTSGCNAATDIAGEAATSATYNGSGDYSSNSSGGDNGGGRLVVFVCGRDREGQLGFGTETMKPWTVSAAGSDEESHEDDEDDFSFDEDLDEDEDEDFDEESCSDSILSTSDVSDAHSDEVTLQRETPRPESANVAVDLTSNANPDDSEGQTPSKPLSEPPTAKVSSILSQLASEAGSKKPSPSATERTKSDTPSTPPIGAVSDSYFKEKVYGGEAGAESCGSGNGDNAVADILRGIGAEKARANALYNELRPRMHISGDSGVGHEVADVMSVWAACDSALRGIDVTDCSAEMCARVRSMQCSVHLNQSLLNLHIGELKTAITEASAALELDPHSVKALYRRAAASSRLARRELHLRGLMMEAFLDAREVYLQRTGNSDTAFLLNSILSDLFVYLRSVRDDTVLTRAFRNSRAAYVVLLNIRTTFDELYGMYAPEVRPQLSAGDLRALFTRACHLCYPELVTTHDDHRISGGLLYLAMDVELMFPGMLESNIL